MENRLRWHWRSVPVVLGFIWISCSPALHAQTSFFNFSYPGPSSIPVGPTCSAALAGNIGTPVVTSTVGAAITQSAFDPVQSGFQLSDQLPPGLHQVHWNVADNQGHTATFVFPVTLVDQSAPVFDLSGIDPTIVVGSITQVPPPPVIPVMDNCTTHTVQFVETTPPAICQGGVFTRTWTATDANSNTSTFTQTITVYADTLPPQITVNPQNGSAPCSMLATAYPAWLNAQMAAFTATDASGTPAYSNNAIVPFPPGCAQNRVVTFRATDACGLVSTRTATFFTDDNAPPIIVQPAQDQVVACSPGGDHIAALSAWIHNRGGLVVYDSCTNPSLLTYQMQVNGNVRDSAGVVADFLTSLNTLDCGFHQVGTQILPKIKGRVRVDFFVWDACGTGPGTNGPSVDQAEFAAMDTLPPTITGPETTEQCGGGNDQAALNAWINQRGNATLTDVCASAVWNNNFTWVTQGGQSGSGTVGTGPYPQVPATTGCDWYVDVTFFATDECGNAGSGALRFRVRDTQPPAFTNLAPAVTLACPPTLPTLPAATVTDNCDTSPVITSTQQVSNQLCAGHYTVTITWRATDACGNTGTALQTFQIIDTTGPVFSIVPPAKTIRCDTFAPLQPPLPGSGILAADACGTVTEYTMVETSTQVPDPAACGHYSYTLTRLFTAEDDCGNTRTATQVITVIDNLGPVFSGFTDTTLVCEIQPVTPPPTAEDACSGPTAPPVVISNTIIPDPCGDSYVKVLQWLATDVCGNTGIFTQTINVRDTLAPVLSGVPADLNVDCTGIPGPPGPGMVTAADNCDESVDVVMTETEIRNLDTTSCDHWSNYMIRREWTATDNCGNSVVRTQTIQVQDNTGPVLIAPPVVLLPNDTGQCGANALLPAPLSIYDECSSTTFSVVLRDSAGLMDPPGTPPDSLGLVAVDTVVFQWPAPNLPPAVPAVGAALLTIRLERTDTENSSETFRILGEGDTLLGQTVTTSQQCLGFSTTAVSVSAALLNSWLSDGQVVIRLVTNGSGLNAVNDLCPDPLAIATLTYAAADQQVPISLQFSVNGGAPAPFPPAAPMFFPVGPTAVTYTATDCAGNSSTATSTLVVQDLEPPLVTAPAPLTVYTAVNNCLATVSLPFPAVSENCALTQDSIFSPLTLVKFETDPNLPSQLVPKDVTLTIPGVVPNAVSGAKLLILNRGDNANPGEFYRVFDESNVLLTVTTPGLAAGECTAFNEKPIAITPAQLNAWAANGSVALRLRANRLASSPDWINPCGPLAPDQSDGISQVQAALVYDYAAVQYTVTNSSAMVVASGPLTGTQTQVTLPPGLYTVAYRVTDAAGIEGMTTFNVTVRDTVAPQAVCQPVITIFTNPSGFVPYILQPSELNDNSTDNCTPAGGLQFQLSQTSFDCPSQPNQSMPVALTVRDSSGNTDVCSTLVVIKTVALAPTYDPVCVGGELKLHANAPAPVGGYSYSWLKTGGTPYTSTASDPSINPATSGYQGLYNVTVTGATGCSSIGSVVVTFAFIDVQPNLSAPAQVCEGSSITLSTTNYQGSNVTYSWYAGSPPLGTLLATTLTQEFIYTPASPGTYQFYVQVGANNCTTQASNPKTVTVNARPVAAVNNASLSVCSCNPILLGTGAMGPGVTYQWTGPGSFNSTQQSPLVAACANQAIHQGNYTLVVTQNGCSSNPSTTTVTVVPQLITPSIGGDTAVCAGDVIEMVVSPSSNPPYYWSGPNNFFDTTLINSLVLPNASTAMNGAWRVKYKTGNCESAASPSFNLVVQNYPIVTAEANSPLCQGALDTLILTGNTNTALATVMWEGPQNYFSLNANAIRINPVPGWYYFTGVTGNGCKGVDSVEVVLVTPPFVILTNDAPECATGSDAFCLQAVINTPNTISEYKWEHGTTTYGVQADSLCFPTFTEADNGLYSLVVKDNFGCLSNKATTTVETHNTPVVPLLLPSDSICVGEMLTVMVENEEDYLSTYSFQWETPLGVPGANTSSLVYPQASAAHAGIYRVTVYNGQCASLQSQPLFVHVLPNPPAPDIPDPDPVCAGDSLHLCVPPVFGASFFWDAPGNVNGNNNCFIINDVNANTVGAYQVQVRVNGCWSPFSEAVFVTSKPVPNKPIAKTLTPAVCLDGTDTLVLQVTAATLTAGAQYQWFDSQDPDNPLAPPSFSPQLQLTDLSGFSAGNHQFYVQAELDGCLSKSLFSVLVKFDNIPGISALTDNDTVDCSVLDLCAQAPSIGSGSWSILNGSGVSISDTNALCPIVTGGVPGSTYSFVWSLSNGGCRNYSRDTLEVRLAQPEQAMVNFADTTLCGGSQLRLDALPGQNSPGAWTILNQAGIFNIVDPTDPNTLVTSVLASGFPANTYTFRWVLQDIGCGASEAKVEVTVLQVPVAAGPDQTICSADGCATLNAQLSFGEFGEWHVVSPAGLSVTTPSSPTSEVCGLQTGANVLYWETNDGFCGDLSRDTVVLYYQVFPTVQPDVIEVPFGTAIEFDVLLNDIAGGQTDVQVTDPPDHAQQFQNLGEGEFLYQPTTSFSGQDQMVYQICNLLCPNSECAATTVTFNVGGAGDCFIPTLITPNDDGANDQFALPESCYSGDSPVEVTIFNQWGDQVFHADAYANQFDGKYSGEYLPVGTYFYVVKLPNETQARRGFLVIQR